MQSLLIKDTTRAQREEIVRRALAACGGSCEGCNGCGNSGGGRVDAIYQPSSPASSTGWMAARFRASTWGALSPLGQALCSASSHHA